MSAVFKRFVARETEVNGWRVWLHTGFALTLFAILFLLGWVIL